MKSSLRRSGRNGSIWRRRITKSTINNDYNLSPVRAHSHNYYEIYFFLEGDAEMNAEEQVFWPKPGEVLVIPPGIVHFLRIRNHEKPYRRIVLWISAGYLEGLTASVGGLRISV